MKILVIAHNEVKAN
jgi:hypothetical protein